MGWLLGSTLASIAASFVVVKIFDYIFTGEAYVDAARAGIFIGTWTAVTAKAGMNGFTKRVKVLRKSIVKRVMP